MVNEFLLREFGNRIIELRKSKSISQKKLAFITGFSPTYIEMVENGERNISLNNLAVFAKAFGITLDELMRFNNADELYNKYQLKSEE